LTYERDEVAGCRRKLYNVEFRNLHCLQIVAYELVGACGTHRKDHKLMLGFGHITWRKDMT